MLAETKHYLVLIRFLILVSFFTFWDVLYFLRYCWYSTFISKTASLKHVSDKVLRARWPHGMYGNIMFLSTSGLFNLIWRILKCVNWHQIISKYDTIFHFGVKIDIFDFCYFLWNFDVTLLSKTASLRHVSDKVLRARWPHGRCGNIMFLSKSAI